MLAKYSRFLPFLAGIRGKNYKNFTINLPLLNAIKRER